MNKKGITTQLIILLVFVILGLTLLSGGRLLTIFNQPFFETNKGEIEFKGVTFDVLNHVGISSAGVCQAGGPCPVELRFDPIVTVSDRFIEVKTSPGTGIGGRSSEGTIHSATALVSKDVDWTQFDEIKIETSVTGNLKVSSQATITFYYYKIAIGNKLMTIFNQDTMKQFNTNVPFAYESIISIEKNDDGTWDVFDVGVTKKYLVTIDEIKSTDELVIIMGSTMNGQGSFAGTSTSTTRIMNVEGVIKPSVVVNPCETMSCSADSICVSDLKGTTALCVEKEIPVITDPIMDEPKPPEPEPDPIISDDSQQEEKSIFQKIIDFIKKIFGF